MEIKAGAPVVAATVKVALAYPRLEAVIVYGPAFVKRVYVVLAVPELSVVALGFENEPWLPLAVKVIGIPDC
jgi:hypothetical protein